MASQKASIEILRRANRMYAERMGNTPLPQGTDWAWLNCYSDAMRFQRGTRSQSGRNFFSITGWFKAEKTGRGRR